MFHVEHQRTRAALKSSATGKRIVIADPGCLPPGMPLSIGNGIRICLHILRVAGEKTRTVGLKLPAACGGELSICKGKNIYL